MEAISPTHFILGTKVQHNKAHSMTQVPMTLTEGQGQRSRSNFPKNGKKPKNWSYLNKIIILRIYIVPNPDNSGSWHFTMALEISANTD